MIQDRTMQELWGVVEELRQRVTELEEASNGTPVQSRYVASINSKRRTFHLMHCKFAKGFMLAGGDFCEFTSRTEALDSGMVPCKICAA